MGTVTFSARKSAQRVTGALALPRAGLNTRVASPDTCRPHSPTGY